MSGFPSERPGSPVKAAVKAVLYLGAAALYFTIIFLLWVFLKVRNARKFLSTGHSA